MITILTLWTLIEHKVTSIHINLKSGEALDQIGQIDNAIAKIVFEKCYTYSPALGSANGIIACRFLNTPCA